MVRYAISYHNMIRTYRSNLDEKSQLNNILVLKFNVIEYGIYICNLEHRYSSFIKIVWNM